MYKRAVQKLVEKLCLKHQLSQKNEHGCSNWEQFRAIFVTRLSSQLPIFVSTGVGSTAVHWQGVWKGRGMEPGASWCPGAGMEVPAMSSCRVQVIPSESHNSPTAPVNHTWKEIFLFKDTGCSSLWFRGSAGYWIRLFNPKSLCPVVKKPY